MSPGICDLCGAPDVKWAYLTDDNARFSFEDTLWKICDECDQIIQRDGLTSLVQHAMDRNPEWQLTPAAIVHVLQVHTAFTESWCARYPLPQEA